MIHENDRQRILDFVEKRERAIRILEQYEAQMHAKNWPFKVRRSKLWDKAWQELVQTVEEKLGRPICGAHNKNAAGTPCKRAPLRNSPRCRLHGGVVMTKIERKSFREDPMTLIEHDPNNTRRRRNFAVEGDPKTEKMMHDYESYLEPNKLDDMIAFCRVRLEQLVAMQAAGQGTVDQWERFQKILDSREGKRALAQKDAEYAIDLLIELKNWSDQHFRAMEEQRFWIDQIRKLSESEEKRLKQYNSRIPLSGVKQLLRVIWIKISEHVSAALPPSAQEKREGVTVSAPAQSILDAIQADMSRLAKSAVETNGVKKVINKVLND